MHCSSASLLRSALISSPSRASTLPPIFLLPAFNAAQSASFSASPSTSARRDGNPNRGVSALRHTGPGKRQKPSYGINIKELPKPVLDPTKRSAITVDPDHGLWDFFPDDRAALSTPVQTTEHGRGWTVPELRNKDWDDLHRLFWKCVKERNRIATMEGERRRLSAGGVELLGSYENSERDRQVRQTMKAVKHVLTERWYAWENARVAAMEDEEVDLYADVEKGEQAYLPKQQSDEPFALGSEDDLRTNPTTLPPPDALRPSGEARV